MNGLRSLRRGASPLLRPALLLAALAAVELNRPSAAALDHVLVQRGEAQLTVSGRIELTAQDGGILLLARDGRLWTIEPQEIARRKRDEVPFAPYDQAELARRLREELGDGFNVYSTQRYLICYNTSRAYAQWTGALLERLQAAFLNFWSNREFDVAEPDMPLVAVVFADRQSYQQYAQREVGDLAGNIIGYYSLRTNRVTMYDLTGSQRPGIIRPRTNSAAQINEMLSRPEAERTVATVIHEAAHQVAFNCGLQRRFADIPLWLSEGIAMYFETPDLSSRKGWRTIGDLNRYRLDRFRLYRARRGANSLASLLADDARFRDATTADDAYAEAWCLNYFLIQQKPKQYLEYMRMMAGKGPLVWDNPEQRLAEFRQHFGDLAELDAEFLRYMARLR